MVYHFNAGFEVENVHMSIQANSREDAENALVDQLKHFTCIDGTVVDWWVNDVKVKEDPNGEQL